MSLKVLIIFKTVKISDKIIKILPYINHTPFRKRVMTSRPLWLTFATV